MSLTLRDIINNILDLNILSFLFFTLFIITILFILIGLIFIFKDTFEYFKEWSNLKKLIKSTLTFFIIIFVTGILMAVFILIAEYSNW